MDALLGGKDMALTVKNMVAKYKATAEEYKDDVLETFYRMTLMGFISWDTYKGFIKEVTE